MQRWILDKPRNPRSAQRRKRMKLSMRSKPVARGISRTHRVVSLLLLVYGVVPAQYQKRIIRNIVLVHGAWVDGSGWKGAYEILVKDGYNVTIVQLPLTSFSDDVAATRRILAQQDGPLSLIHISEPTRLLSISYAVFC